MAARCAWTWFAALLGLLGACSGDAARPRTRASGSGSAESTRAAVSTVDGHAIELSEVKSLAYATGLPLREALRRLQAERLLMDEATRRGSFDQAWPVHDVARRAAVQALLALEADAVEVSASEIRDAYEKARARFEIPERRVAVHVLAPVAPDAPAELDAQARAYVAKVVPQLAAAADPVAFVSAQQGRSEGPLTIIGERIPALPRVGVLVKPFEDAMFALPSAGSAKEPVRTRFGWHALRVIEIIPAVSTPYASAAETLEHELRLARQTEHVRALVEALRRRYPVVIPESSRQALAELEM